MTNAKFQSEIQSLNTFVQTFCQGNKHSNPCTKEVQVDYKNESYFYKIHLCQECYKTISYSYIKLQSCPHEIKPRCRHCKKPCYNKKKWKELATIMRYSAIKLGLNKITKKVKNFFLS